MLFPPPVPPSPAHATRRNAQVERKAALTVGEVSSLLSADYSSNSLKRRAVRRDYSPPPPPPVAAAAGVCLRRAAIHVAVGSRWIDRHLGPVSSSTLCVSVWLCARVISAGDGSDEAAMTLAFRKLWHSSAVGMEGERGVGVELLPPALALFRHGLTATHWQF